MNSFQELGLEPTLLQAITDLGFKEPSEIQQKAIPLLLTKTTDLVALAQTGTGKTAAFGFPLLQSIDAKSRTVQGLILTPTRELCLQISNELRLYAKYVKGLKIVSVYGGASITEQAKSIRAGAQIAVATPGRLKDMIERRLLDISKIEYCILDEADEMLNMGFYDDIMNILSYTPDHKLTWLFSATMPREVEVIAKKFMKNPAQITVGARNTGIDTVRHEYYVVGGRDRYEALKRLADSNPGIFSVVFCRTKRDTQRVAEKLIEDGYNAGALHGDLSQNQRDLVMGSFRKNQIQLLVATDVAARGIDVDDITHVINYQLPDEIETYTHRSGRTGRAGKSGVSMVIITRSEHGKIKRIEKKINQKFEEKPIPSGLEICEIQLYHLANKIKNTEIDESITGFLPAIADVLEGIDRNDLIKKIFTVEFSRYYSYYQKKRELSSGSVKSGSTDFSSNGDSVRFFINLGERDGFDWKSLKDFLKKKLNLERDDIYKMDVKGSFSFFNTDAALSGLVVESLASFQYEGRTVKVEISNAPKSGRRSKGKTGRKRNYDAPASKKRSRPKSKNSGRPKRKQKKGFY
ncbi:MAG: DEAD/DEAH box helicase [Flavobacteriaceae bacterium]